ncbi:MAG: hypothetical protein AAF420_04565 [Pseudomonadota bacterium]
MRHLLGLTLCGLLVACTGSPVLEADSSAQTTVDPWQLEFDMSGGFAGTIQNALVEYTGNIRAHDKRRKVTKSATLAESDLQELTDLLESLPTSGNSLKTTPSGQSCNDCFYYQLRIARGGKEYLSAFNSLHLGTEPAAPLVRKLIEIMHQTLELK